MPGLGRLTHLAHLFSADRERKLHTDISRPHRVAGETIFMTQSLRHRLAWKACEMQALAQESDSLL